MTYDNNKRLRLLFLLNIAENASDHDPREGVELPAGPVLDGALPQVPGVRLHRRVGDDLGPHSIGEKIPPKIITKVKFGEEIFIDNFFRRFFFYCHFLMGFVRIFVSSFKSNRFPASARTR